MLKGRSIIVVSLLVAAAWPGVAHAADIGWDGGGDAIHWSDANNWSTNTVPASNDAVTIGGGVTVHLDVSFRVGQSVAVGDGFGGSSTVLVIDSGKTLTLDGDQNGLTVQGGASLVNNGVLTQGPAFSRFNLRGGFTNSLGGLVSGLVQVDADGNAGPGGMQLLNNGTMTNVAIVAGRGVVNNNATMTGVRFSTRDVIPATINNNAGATIDNSSSGQISITNADSALTNRGSINNGVGRSISFLGLFDNRGTITNNGSISATCQTGYSPRYGLFTNSGTVTGNPVVEYCKIWTGAGDGNNWSDPRNWSLNTAPSPAGAPFGIIIGGSSASDVHLDTNYALTASLYLVGPSANTFTINAGKTLTINNFQDFINSQRVVNNGAIVNNYNYLNGFAGPGTTTNNGTFTNNNLTLVQVTGSTFTNSGTGSIANAGTFRVDCGATFTNNGTFTGTAGEICGPAAWDGGGDGIHWSDPLNWDTNLVPNDQSAVTIGGGVTVHLDVSFRVGQSVAVGDGFGGSSTVLVIDSGKTLTLDGDQNGLTVQGGASLVNNGVLTQGPAFSRFNLRGGFTNSLGGLVSGLVQVDADGNAGPGGMQLLNNGTMTNVAIVAGRGVVNNNATMTGVRFSTRDVIPATINNNAGATIDNSSSGQISITNADSALTNRGSINNGVGRSISFLGLFDNRGTITNNGSISATCQTGYSPRYGLFTNSGTVTGNPVVEYCKIWTGAGDGNNWSDPRNWSLNTAPSPAGAPFGIIIGGSSASDVHLDTNYALTASLYLVGPSANTFTINAGKTLTINNFQDFINSQRVVNNGAIVNNYNYLNGFAGPGTTTNNGTFTNNNLTLVQVTGSTFTNSGTFTNTADVTNDAIFTNACGSTYTGAAPHGAGTVTTQSCTPVLTVPSGIVQQSLSALGNTVVYAASALDAVDGAIVPVCSPASGSAFALGTTTVTCTATNLAGNSASASFPVTLSVVAIGSAPPVVSTSQPAPFAWSALFVTRFACSLDGAPFAACSSPRTYHGLAAGAHTLCVRATADVQPTCRSWTIVSPGRPVVTIAGVSVVGRSATVSFSSDQPAGRFTCSLDGAAYRTCSPPLTYRGLALGTHTVQVLATNFAGDASAAPASTLFVVS